MDPAVFAVLLFEEGDLVHPEVLHPVLETAAAPERQDHSFFDWVVGRQRLQVSVAVVGEHEKVLKGVSFTKVACPRF